MIWILILVLTHPILVTPAVYTMSIFPTVFASRAVCEDTAADQMKHKSVYLAYCQEIKPVLVK